ncbi:MAG: polyvinyl alcohol dehydrogenase (cytochrome) [Candidatus Azotimanducaceae bacterium]|jgi:polyvinyl alcohol dehydrogenase (cytochrome)
MNHRMNYRMNLKKSLCMNVSGLVRGWLCVLSLLTLVACDSASPPDSTVRGTVDGNAAVSNIEMSKPDTLSSTDEMQNGAGDFDRTNHAGKIIYEAHCESCHSGAVPKAPHFSWLEMMSPGVIHRSLSDGVMKVQGEGLDAEQKLLVTEYLTRRHLAGIEDLATPAPPMCPNRALDIDGPTPAVNWGHDTNRYSPSTVAGLNAEDIPDLALKWAFAFPDAFRARSQPSIGMGAVFVGSQDGTVYAFDLETGCAKWTFAAGAEIRTGIVLSVSEDSVSLANPPLAFFGDIVARFYAVNALTGELVWSLKADEHPSATLTGTPAFFNDRLFIPVSSLEVIPAADPAYPCCTFRGSILAVDAASGEVQWQHFTIPSEPKVVGKTTIGTNILAPSGAPTWTSPTVDRKRNLIYIGTGENYSSPAEGNSDAVLAINMSSGERVWTRQTTAGDAWNVACMMIDNPNCPMEDGPDFDHGSSILLLDLGDGKDALVAGHKNGTVLGLDPDNNGELLWQTHVGRGSIQGGVHFGLAASGSQVYVPINDMNNTRNGDQLDPEKARPGMHSVDGASGKKLWSHVQQNVCDPADEFCDPGISAPATAIPGAVFAGHLDGFIRAYEQKTGDLLWEYDTRPEIVGVNGVTGHGGGISGAGAAVVSGHVVINSGYGLYNHEAGNLLMVFAVPPED